MSDRLRLARVLDRVVDEVDDRLPQRLLVRGHVRQVLLHVHRQREPLLLDLEAVGLDHLAHHARHVRGREAVLLAPGLDAREVEDVVDELGEAVALLVDDAVVLMRLLLAGHASRAPGSPRRGG
jgi:hypothetical protein